MKQDLVASTANVGDLVLAERRDQERIDAHVAAISVPLYPIVLAVGLVVVVMDISGVSPFAASRTLLATVILATLVSVGSTLLLRDRHRGGVFAVLVLLCFTASDVRLLWLIVAGMGLLLLERYRLPRLRQTIRWPMVGTVASRLSIILVLAVAIQALQLGSIGLIWRAVLTETILQPGPSAIVSSRDPDIYLVLLDGHARLDVAQTVFGVDPGPIRSGLTDRGFTISERSRSNYPFTTHTLASLFSQAYLTDIPRMAGLLSGTESRPAGSIVESVINDNVTLSTLRSRGYEIEGIASGFEQVSLREADRFIDTGQMNEFEVATLRRSALDDIIGPALADIASSQQRDRIQQGFDVLATAPTRASDHPTFVFAHLPSPHPPWVFDADGSPRTADPASLYMETPEETGIAEDDLATAYAGQMVDTDRRLLSALDRLDAAIDARGRPAVIVVFSDHGSWIHSDRLGEQVRFKDLLAVRGSDVSLALDQDLTLVNLMPSLFHQIFGLPYSPRPDALFMAGDRDGFDLLPLDDPDGPTGRLPQMSVSTIDQSASALAEGERDSP